MPTKVTEDFPTSYQILITDKIWIYMLSMKEKKTKLILCFTPFKVKIITSKTFLKRCRQTWLSSIANRSIIYVSVCDFFCHPSPKLTPHFGYVAKLTKAAHDYLRRVYFSMVVTASSIPSAPCFTRGRMMWSLRDCAYSRLKEVLLTPADSRVWISSSCTNENVTSQIKG